jgi:hypothetical protein
VAGNHHSAIIGCHDKENEQGMKHPSLFDASEAIDPIKSSNLLPKDGEVLFMPDFFSAKASDHFYQSLLHNIQWQQDQIKLYGKSIALPRLTAWYGEKHKPYTYSGITMQPTCLDSGIAGNKKQHRTGGEGQFY